MENIDFMGSDPRSEFRGCVKFGPSAVSRLQGPDFARPPLGRSPDRPPVGSDPHLSAQPELFRSPSDMAFGAQASDIAVLVRTSMGERDDVVRHGRLADNPGGGAITAEGFGP